MKILTGSRVTSKQSQAIESDRKQELTEKNIGLISMIPKYPNEISIYEVAARLHTSRRGIESRLTTCEGRALICQERGKLSILDPNFSY